MRISTLILVVSIAVCSCGTIYSSEDTDDKAIDELAIDESKEEPKQNEVNITTKCDKQPTEAMVDYSHKYFEDIKNEVNSRRDMLAKRIQEYTQQIINNITVIQNESQNKSEDMRDLYNNFETMKIKLHELVMLDEIPEDTNSQLVEFKPKYERILKDYRKILFGRDYKLKFSHLLIRDIFGTLNIQGRYRQFSGSNILNATSTGDLLKICEFDPAKKWSLIYRATDDGFSASSFHKKCDGKKDVLVIVEANKYIFGGYTEKGFQSNDGYQNDRKAFLYSLVNKENNPFKAKSKTDKSHIYSNSNYGPTWGTGHDIKISSNSNKNLDSYTYFGSGYSHPDYNGPNTRSKEIFAGAYNFKTTEVEVWQREN